MLTHLFTRLLGEMLINFIYSLKHVVLCVLHRCSIVQFYDFFYLEKKKCLHLNFQIQRPITCTALATIKLPFQKSIGSKVYQ